MAANILIFTWSGLEALACYRGMRKRLELGLADAVVADRVRLWAIAILTAAGISLASLTLELMGIQAGASTNGALIVGPFGLVAAGSLWLACLPPRAYLRRVAARAKT